MPPRAAYLATHPKEKKIQAATVREICRRMFQYRAEANRFAAATLQLANDARAVGLFALEFIEALPGKRMTVDFWKQLSALFLERGCVPPHQPQQSKAPAAAGLRHSRAPKALTQEQFNLFIRIARNNPDPFTDVQIALSWRQSLLAAAGFVLPGKRAAGHAKTVNHYNRFFDVMSEKKLALVLSNLEADPNFGPMEHWPESRKQSVRLQLAPHYARLAEMQEKLAGN